MTIGVSWSAVCTVAVPDAVSATSAAASTPSVSPFDERDRREPGRPRARRTDDRRGSARARSTNCAPRHRARIRAAAATSVGRIRVDLVRPAAGQHRDRRRVGREPVPPAETRPAAPPRSPDRRAGGRRTPRARRRRDRSLSSNGKITSTRSAIVANRLQPSRPPRPDLRADVVDDRNAEPLDAARQRKVEVGKIDDDERVGTIRRALTPPAPERGPRSRQLADRFGQAGHREAAIVVDEPPPAAANCGPPRPATVACGSSARSSRVSAPAYRSPDGSPHDSSRRVVKAGDV